MNTLITFEIAKLLKEKGFEQKIISFDYYLPNGDKADFMYANNNKNYRDYSFYSPTIAEVVMWIYEKKGIWIEVRKHTRNGLLCFSPYVDNKSIKEDIFFNDYDSPTEAYLESITYTLNNLL